MKRIVLSSLFILALTFFLINCSNTTTETKTLTIKINDSLVSKSSTIKLIEIIGKRLKLMKVDTFKIEQVSEKLLHLEYTTEHKDLFNLSAIEKRGLLEFKLFANFFYFYYAMNRIDSALAKHPEVIGLEETSENNELDVYEQIKRSNDLKLKREHPFYSIVAFDRKGRTADAFVRMQEIELLKNILELTEVNELIPEDLEFVLSANTVIDNNGEEYYRLYLVNSTPILDGDIISDASYKEIPLSDNYVVSIVMNKEATKKFSEITRAYVDSRLAFIIDGQVYLAPVIKTPITDGRSIIEGLNNINEAIVLSTILRTGTLPYSITIINEQVAN